MRPMYAHQDTIYDKIATHDFYAVFAEQGTGKTLPMLKHILRLIQSGRIRNALIICPKAVRGSWDRDIDKFFNRLEQALLHKCLVVTTYDLIWRRPEYNRGWDLVCLDESHFIKNRTSCRYAGQFQTVEDSTTGRKKRIHTAGIKHISLSARYRYIMTGTPIGNSHWEEIWAQFNFLSPEIFGKYSDFERRYCILNQFYKPWRYINVEELRDKILAHSFRITKVECLDLPEKLPPERFTVELREKTLYKEMLQNYIAELDIEAKNPLSRLTKLRQMCSGSVLDENGKPHRLDCDKPGILEEFLDNWEKKLVIFAEYKESIRDITKALGKKKVSYVVLDGAQKDKTIWRRFQEDPKIQVIICQYRTGSAGIDLFAADTILFYEPTLSSQTFEQAGDRIHRPGQKEKCSYILFETEGTVEAKIWNALMRHRDFDETELWQYVKGVV